MVVHACYLNTWVVEAGTSGVQDHPSLLRDTQAILGYMRLSQKKKKKVITVIKITRTNSHNAVRREKSNCSWSISLGS